MGEMKRASWIAVPAVLTVLWVLFLSCSKDQKDDKDANDLDSGTDTDTDSDTDTDTDSDSDSDTGTDSDTDSDSDTDTDTDTDTDSDGGTDTDTDSDGDLPPGCVFVDSVDAAAWQADHGVQGDYMVWRDFNDVTDCHELKLRQLSTGTVVVLDSDTELEQHPVIWGDWAYWEERVGGDDWWRWEIFKGNIFSYSPEQLTDNSCADGKVRGGENHFVFGQNCDGGDVSPLYYAELSTLTPNEITPDVTSSPGTAGLMFDGVRYVAWGWHDDSLGGNDLIYLFDIENPSTPSEPLYPEA